MDAPTTRVIMPAMIRDDDDLTRPSLCRVELLERMYTHLVKFRLFAFAVALLLAATPVLGVVCQMDCDQQSAAPPCHQSMSAPNGPMVRGTHRCDHDHAGGSPAVQAGTTARDSLGALVDVSVPAVSHAVTADVRSTVAATYGQPGSTTLSPSFRTTVMRI